VRALAEIHVDLWWQCDPSHLFDLAAGVEWAPDQEGNAGARAFAQSRVVGGWAF